MVNQVKVFFQLCQDVIDCLDKVDPGLNKWRFNMMTEVNKVKVALKLRKN